jgi:uncharacterized protein YjbJ (UPF0337 family)
MHETYRERNYDDMLEGQWKQIRGKIKEFWGDLTDDDLDRINGRRDQMVGALQERYGYTRDDADHRLTAFLDDLDEPM